MVIAIASARLLVEAIEQKLVGDGAGRSAERCGLDGIEERTCVSDAVVNNLLLPYLDHLVSPSLLVGVDVLLGDWCLDVFISILHN